MRWFVPVTLVLFVSSLIGSASARAAAADIKALIPAATAMSPDDFQKLATSAEGMKPSDFAEQSLTVMLLGVQRGRSEEAEKEFKWLFEGGMAKPSAIVDEISRQGPLLRKLGVRPEPITFVHADRITGCTCTVKADTATGTVSYQAPGLYEGKFDYIAKREKGKWQITELVMPARKTHIVRNAKGMWEKSK
jgi:hypothetical protein